MTYERPDSQTAEIPQATVDVVDELMQPSAYESAGFLQDETDTSVEALLEASLDRMVDATEDMRSSLDIELYTQFDRRSYETLRDNIGLDIQIGSTMHQTFADTYAPSLMEVIETHMSRRKAAAKRIDSILSLYDKTASAIIAFEREVYSVPEKLIGTVTALGRVDPYLDPKQTPFDKNAVIEARVESDTVSTVNSMIDLGHNIGRLRYSQERFEEAHRMFVQSSDFLAKRIDGVTGFHAVDSLTGMASVQKREVVADTHSDKWDSAMAGMPDRDLVQPSNLSRARKGIKQ